MKRLGNILFSLLLLSATANAVAGLDASFQALPAYVLPGQAFTVAMQVHNTDGGNAATGVSPLLFVIEDGFQAALLGVSPSSQSIPAGNTGVFTWTFSGSQCGSVYFTGSASGLDGGQVTSLSATSAIISMICTPTPTPVIIYATPTPLPAQGSAVILGNVYHPLLGQPLQMNYVVPFAGPINVSIYNRNGKKLKEIQVDAQAGQGSLSWDGRADDGDLVASGVYAAFFKGKGLSKMVKLVVVK